MKKTEVRQLATANTFRATAPMSVDMSATTITPHVESDLHGYCSNFHGGRFDGYKSASENTWKDCERTYYHAPTWGMSDMEAVITSKTDMAIVMHCLKVLWTHGNESAWRLAHGGNGILSIDDLRQELLMVLADNQSAWHYDEEHGVIPHDDNAVKLIYGVVARTLYNFQQKHYAHTYIEIDGDVVDAENITALATYADINDVLCNETILEFRDSLTLREESFLTMRVKGYSLQKIAEKMDITRDKVRTIEKHVRQKWEVFNKE